MKSIFVLVIIFSMVSICQCYTFNYTFDVTPKFPLSFSYYSDKINEITLSNLNNYPLVSAQIKVLVGNNIYQELDAVYQKMGTQCVFKVESYLKNGAPLKLKIYAQVLQESEILVSIVEREVEYERNNTIDNTSLIFFGTATVFLILYFIIATKKCLSFDPFFIERLWTFNKKKYY